MPIVAMSDRVHRLREQSVRTDPFISVERARLVTEFYRDGAHDSSSVPVTRALVFRYIIENKAVTINDGELIIGERGPSPKATPTYPELCCHSLKDLDIANSRARTRFIVSDEVKRFYKDEAIPFWRGRTMRERVFGAMTEEWKVAFEAGVFTEFMEQRAPGHAILDDKIYRGGLVEIITEIEKRISEIDFLGDPEAYAKSEELKAMKIAAHAIIAYAQRHADKARELADSEQDTKRKAELDTIAEICSHVPAHAPRTFWEALQAYWFIHLAVVTELNVWDSFNPGRLDQHLYPFYRREVDSGKLTSEFAKELLQCFWIKFNNQPAPPKVDVTEAQSGTYQDFALINSGGLKPDGTDGVNELSYMILDVCNEMRLIQPSVCVQVSTSNPERFLKKAVDVAKEGFGQPSMFNTDMIIKEFLRAGKTIDDARRGGPSGCVEVSVFGKEACILTGYCNWSKIMEIALNNGVDPKTGRRIGLETGDPTRFKTFADLLEAYKKQLRHFIDIKIRGNNVIERLYAQYMPTPVMSLLFDGCIEKARDYHDGGPKYNSTYIQGVGMGTVTDSLSAIKHHVFETRGVRMSDLLRGLSANFENEEVLRMMLLTKTPKYGNDDDRADDIARAVFDAYFECIDSRPNTKGGQYRVNLLPTTVHVYFGEKTGATPDGRKAGTPVSDGISPSHGADRKGPTAVIKSAAKIDHSKTGGTLLNQKFLPQVLATEEGRDKLAALVRSFFELGGHHIQFNVVTEETLRDAQVRPQEYRDLIVRVAGYSDHFVNLGRELQDEIISRTSQSQI